MSDSIFLQLSADAGIVATLILTVNYLFGILISTSYQRSTLYNKLPKSLKSVNIYNWHNWTAYIVLTLVLLHPVLLLFDPLTKFTFVDIVFPINAPTQKLFVALGTISMFAIVLVILTTQKFVKNRLGFRTWKNIHLISYATGLLFIVHGIVMDPELKNRPVDFLDAEKVASEACFLILLAAIYFRVRYEIKKRHSSKFYKLRVLNVISETTDAKSFVLDIPGNLKDVFTYTPGQFIKLKLMVNSKEYKRAYSLSSSPVTDDGFYFTIKRVKDGIVSNLLNDTLTPGYELLVLPPSGNFFKEYPSSDPTHFVFFAGGSGITPVYSIIKSLLTKQPHSHLSLIYANRDLDSIIFKRELELLEASYRERLTITHVLSAASAGWGGLKGRLDQDKIVQFMNKWMIMPVADTVYYVCGPSPFMELVEQELAYHKIQPSKIHLEKFVSISNEEDPLKAGTGLEDIGTAGASLNAQLDGNNHQTNCKKDQILLDVLLAAGINAPYSCREGICSSCKAKLVEGMVIMKKHTALSDTDIKNDHILTCQATLLSAKIKIDFDTVK
ncbi:ferredoxin--NADP reductase [Mucilaginibacter flavidus]|uniref:ferredoxin--NADP reductase n=1 Tax=Mucilaginibacter flavidus TaxID=2949309 RepID=UPI0020926B53|nr:ferredoxin--NADP reductase [Mucilaginibacter flavidus]MCO5950861.1 ferredoxin--NADP reductase [Mucilaginibacter flavidus]